MVETPSRMTALGTPVPDFSLPDAVSGRTVSSADFADERALAVLFLCNHCPFVQHVREGLAAFSRDYEGRDVGIVAISSNDVGEYPQDGPEEMKREAERAGYRFPYLYDESQDVARAFGAACTPDFFLYGPERTLVYRGQFDASRPGNGVPVTGADLRAAVDAVLEGRPVPSEQRPSIGCNIKWRA